MAVRVRPVGRADRPAQLADQLGQHQRAARAGAPGRSAWSGGQRVELVEEAGRLLVLALHGADQQGVPRPACTRRRTACAPRRAAARPGTPWRRWARPRPASEVDEPLVAQQAAAQPQVGPGALLDAGHGDDVPLAAARGVGREQLDGVAARGAVGERVARELLFGEVLGEGGDVGAGEPVGEAGGGVEEGEDGVEVTVGGRADGAAAGAGLAPPAVEAAGLPDPPEHLLGALARTRRLRPRPRAGRPTRRSGAVSRAGRAASGSGRPAAAARRASTSSGSLPTRSASAGPLGTACASAAAACAAGVRPAAAACGGLSADRGRISAARGRIRCSACGRQLPWLSTCRIHIGRTAGHAPCDVGSGRLR